MLWALCFWPLGCLRVGFDRPDGSAGGERDGDADESDVGRFDADPDDASDAPDSDMDAPSDVDDPSDVDTPSDADSDPDVDLDEPLDPLIVVTNLREDWATPASICWAWDRTGDATSFARYELVVGMSQADVESQSGSAVVLTSTTHAELGWFELPIAGRDPVISTIVIDLEESTTYHAQLRAFDLNGTPSVSNVAQATTVPQPGRELVLFSDAETLGYSIPAEMTRSSQAPFAGTHHYTWQADCAAERECFENLRRQSIDLSFSAFDLTSFGSAYYEFAVASDSQVPSHWSHARLFFGDDAAHSLYIYSGWVMTPDEGYQVYQIPLRVFHDDDVLLDGAMVQNGIWEFTVGGVFSHGATVRIDEVRIRY